MSMRTTVVYDTITGKYIDRVPTYEKGKSCKIRGEKHLWVLNTAHNEVCIRCGLSSRTTSFYRFAIKVGLLEPKEAKKTERRRAER